MGPSLFLLLVTAYCGQLQWLLHHLELRAYEVVSQHVGERAVQTVSILLEPMQDLPPFLLEEAVELVS